MTHITQMYYSFTQPFYWSDCTQKRWRVIKITYSCYFLIAQPHPVYKKPNTEPGYHLSQWLLESIRIKDRAVYWHGHVTEGYLAKELYKGFPGRPNISDKRRGRFLKNSSTLGYYCKQVDSNEKASLMNQCCWLFFLLLLVFEKWRQQALNLRK